MGLRQCGRRVRLRVGVALLCRESERDDRGPYAVSHEGHLFHRMHGQRDQYVVREEPQMGYGESHHRRTAELGANDYQVEHRPRQPRWPAEWWLSRVPGTRDDR